MTAPPAQTSKRGLPWKALLATAAGVAVVLLVLGGVASLLASAGDGETRVVGDVRDGRVSADVYDRIELQTPKQQVLEALRPAEPVDMRVLDRYDLRSPATVATSCVYYDAEGVRAGALYRFCFDGDVLVDKTVVLPKDAG